MIQRIQTLYLIVAALLSASLFFLSFGTFYSTDGLTVINFSILGISNVDGSKSELFGSVFTLPLLIIDIFLILMPIYTLLRYKHRTHQLKFIQLDILLNVLFVAILFIFYLSKIEKSVGNSETEYELGIIMPLVAIVFEMLAMRGVKKDIALLRSADRIR